MDGTWRRSLHRRDFLRASVLTTAGLLAACGTSSPATQPPAASTPAATTTPTTAAAAAAPTPTAVATAPLVQQAKTVTLHHPDWAGSHGNHVGYVQRVIFDRLFDQAHDGTLLPTLAEKWAWSADATSITFSLRQGVKFHDGTPFTAKDVVASIKAVASPHLGGNFARFRPLKGVEAYGKDQADEIAGLKVVDDHTVTFEFERSAAGFFAYSAFGRDGVNILPAHIWEPNIKKARSGEISLKEYGNPWYWSKEATIGTGSFAYVEGAPEKLIRVESASESWRGKPLLNTILWPNVGTADTQFLAFQKGEIDVLTYQPEYAEQIAKTANVKADSFTTPYIQIFEVNTRDNGFGLTDARVRQAISSAINREAINDGLYRGFNNPWTAILQGEWNNKAAPQFPYNPDKAKQLLQESGFDRNQELVLAYDYPGTLPQRLMEAIQADLQAVGFKTRLLHLEGPGAEETRKAGKWTTWLNAFASHYSPFVTALALRTDGAQNAGEWGSPALDEKFSRAEALSNPAAQKEIFAEIQATAQTETYLIPLWQRGTKVAYQGRLSGWDTNTTAAFSMFGFHYFGAEKWDVA